MKTRTCLKTFLITLFSLLSATSVYASNATKIIIIDEQIDNSLAIFELRFNTNKRLGRAWIEAVLEYDNPDKGIGYAARGLIPGLSYDVSQKQIVLQTDNKRIVCANVKGPTWRVPLGDTIVPTKTCLLSARIERRKQDNGYEVFEVPFLHVEMSVVDP